MDTALRASELGLRALGAAVHRLEAIAPDAILQAVCHELLGDILATYGDRFGRLNDSLRQTLLLNGLEWLIADGACCLPCSGERRQTLSLILQPETAEEPLADDERGWLEELGQRELGIFRIGSIAPGLGVALHDPIDRARPPLWICASQQTDPLVQGQVYALRPVRLDGEWALSVARYRFVSSFYGVSVALAIRDDAVLDELPPGATPESATQHLRWARSVAITRAWLDERLELMHVPPTVKRQLRRPPFPRPPRRRLR